MNYMNTGIYQISFTDSEKRYIGSAVDLAGRRDNHLSYLKNGKHKNPHLQNAWNKYGEGAYRFDILLYCDPTNCVLYEQMAIDAFSPERLYNIALIAGSNLGIKHKCSEETKDLIRKLAIGRKHTIETCKKISVLKSNPSQETRDRARLGSIGNTNGHGNLGRTAWNKGKVGLQIAWNKGKTNSEETRKKISDGNKGKTWSPEQREKMMLILNNQSLETRKKISQSVKRSWKNRKEMVLL